MLIYTFWNSKDYDPNLPKVTEIPFEDIEDMFEDSLGEMDIIVSKWIKSKFPNYSLKYWGEVPEKSKEFLKCIDEKTKTMFDIQDVIFRSYDISFYFKLDICLEILNYLASTGQAYSGVDGIIFKTAKTKSFETILSDIKSNIKKEKASA